MTQIPGICACWHCAGLSLCHVLFHARHASQSLQRYGAFEMAEIPTRGIVESVFGTPDVERQIAMRPVSWQSA